MPASGDQHLTSTISNPFEEKQPRMSEYTAKEIATLQSRLEKQLGPEYISSRAGPGGGKVHYVAAEKCIQLANEIFGFNGWSSTVKEWQVDFLDENATTLKVSMGISVIVRVTLKDGTFHEDIGYGHIENCKGKAAAFEKCKKEGTTDALKRALRNFGNALGNCIYDKDYLGKVTKMKVQPGKWDPDRLHRHADHQPVKKAPEVSKPQDDKSQIGGVATSMMSEDTFDDEFEDGDFDDADFSLGDPDSHPDEVVLPPLAAKSHNFNGVRNGSGPITNGTTPNQARPPANHQQPTRPLDGIQVASNGNLISQPQTPNGRFARSASGAGPGNQMRPPHPLQDSGAPGRLNPAQPVVAGRMPNQPSRMGTGIQSAPASPNKLIKSQEDEDKDEDLGMPPPGAGFFSARAAAMVPESAKADALPESHPQNLPVFNTKLESPSIRKTPGIDYKGSRPVTKDLKQLPGTSLIQATGGTIGARPNIMNPQLDVTRRIGAPGSPSPNANRGQYKPPTIKRPVDGGGGGGGGGLARTPLVDLPANGAMGTCEAGGDMKRQRLSK